MTGYKIGMAEEAVIADLTAKLVECQKDRDAWENACLDWENETIAAKAREAKLKDALKTLMSAPFDYPDDEYQQRALADAMSYANMLLNRPHDDTALKEFKRRVLLDAAEFASTQGDIDFVVWQLRRMAEE